MPKPNWIDFHLNFYSDICIQSGKYCVYTSDHLTSSFERERSSRFLLAIKFYNFRHQMLVIHGAHGFQRLSSQCLACQRLERMDICKIRARMRKPNKYKIETNVNASSKCFKSK